jgi:translation initiation factor IF-1
VASEGKIVEALPGSLYRVQLPDGQTVLAHIAAKMRLTHVRALPGDRVALELSPYDRSRARIVRKLS